MTVAGLSCGTRVPRRPYPTRLAKAWLVTRLEQESILMHGQREVIGPTVKRINGIGVVVGELPLLFEGAERIAAKPALSLTSPDGR